MIINTTFFDGGELNIPGTDTTAISESLDDIIGIYEPDYLKKALSYPLWKLFNATLPIPPAGRFADLLNGGVEYTDSNGYVKEWGGFNTVFTSPIAMYIWYWFQRKIASYNTPGGEQKGKTENAQNVGVDTKQMQQWNKMSRITCDLWQYLQYSVNGDGSPKYPEFDICQTGKFGVLNQCNL